MAEIGKISIIGPGRVGQTLGRVLADRGCPIADVVGRRADGVKQAVEFIGAGRGLVNLHGLGADFQVLFIAVPDDDIEGVAAQLAASQNRLAHKTAFHVSGLHSSDILNPLARRGMHTGSVHPLMSFPDPSTAIEQLAGIYYCLEGDEEALAVAKQMVALLEGTHFSIASEHKPLYHAAAVLACGQMIALLDVAFSLCQSIGIDQATTRAALLPLIRSAVTGVERFGPAKAMTGPFARGDLGTIQKHVSALERLNPDYANIYRALGRQALEISGIEEKQKTALRELLLD